MTNQTESQDKTVPESAKPAEPKPNSTPEPSIFQIFQNTVGVLVALSVIFSIIGFIYILGIVSRQTTLFSFDSNPITYLTYGVSISLLSLIENFGVIAVLVVIIVVFVIVTAVREYNLNNKGQRLLSRIVRLIISLFGNVLVPSLLLCMILFGFSSAIHPESLTDMVNSVPQKTHIISLVLKDNISPLTWHLLVDENNPRRTKPLSLIFEFTDSVLVKDPQTGSVVKISKDQLAGIIDDTGLDPSKLPTITPTPTP